MESSDELLPTQEKSELNLLRLDKLDGEIPLIW